MFSILQESALFKRLNGEAPSFDLKEAIQGALNSVPSLWLSTEPGLVGTQGGCGQSI